MTDPYQSDAFWDRYRDFAERSRPRHTQATRVLLDTLDGAGAFFTNPRVLDLGCGRAQISQEVLADLVPDTIWYGTDNDPKTSAGNPRIARVDFSDISEVVRWVAKVKPTLVTSFFATDVVLGRSKALDLYRTILEPGSGVEAVLTAGFYYDDHRRGLTPVREEGGLLSYQVPRAFSKCSDISESRFAVQAPSEMFGPDVVEVLSLYRRRET